MLLRVSLLAVLLAGSPAHAASYRPNAVVQGNDVTLGDLFEDAGENAGKVVAHAPEPGRRMVFDARALASLALANHLDWRPSSPQDRAVVERSAIVVNAGKIRSQIEDALAEKGVARPFAAVFDQAVQSLVLPSDTGQPAIQSLTFDPAQRRFSGTLVVQTSTGPLSIPVSGQVAAVVQVPVLNRSVDPGNIVNAGDLDLIAVQEDRIARDTLRDSADIIGRKAARLLQANRPLRTNDLERDLIVKRGKNVTLILDNPNLSLTTTGRALTDGAKGETVKVINPSSSRVVEGLVAGPDLVAISDSLPPLAGDARTSVQ